MKIKQCVTSFAEPGRFIPEGAWEAGWMNGDFYSCLERDAVVSY